MTEPEYRKYVSHKTNILTLFAGILIGVLTNYIALFFSQSFVGLIFCLSGIIAVSLFVISRQQGPAFSVTREFPEGFVRGEPNSIVAERENYERLIARFIYLANRDISRYWDTLFRPGKYQLGAIASLGGFLPMSQHKYTKEMERIARILPLSDNEKSTLKHAVESYYGRSMLFVERQLFRYQSVSNRLLRGKGFLGLLIEDNKASIICRIMPSFSCIASSHYEEYHIFLRRKLERILKRLMDDQEVKDIALSLYE